MRLTAVFFGGVLDEGIFVGRRRKRRREGLGEKKGERERERVMKRCFLFVVMRKGKRES